MRARSLLAKALAGMLLLFVAALVLAPFLLKKYLPPEKVRGLILANAQKSLHREIKLGEVSYSLLKGLTLSELAVSEAPDFHAGQFAAMRAFNLNIRWLPLLHRRVSVESISVDGLRLNVVKRGDGLFNFSDLAGSTEPAKAAQPSSRAGEGLPFDINVRRADITDGQISYRDLSAGDEISLSEARAKIRNFSLAGPFDAELGVRASGRAGGRPIDAAVSYSGRLDLGGRNPRKMSADFKKLAVNYSGLRLTASGRAQGLAAPKLDVKAALAAGGATILEGQFAGSVVLPLSGAAPAVSGEFRAKTPGFKATDVKDIGLPGKLVVPAGQASGKIDLKDDQAVFNALHLESEAGTVDVSGTVANLSSGAPKPDLDFSTRLNLPEIRVSQLPFSGLPAGLILPAAAVEAKGRFKADAVHLDALHVKTKAGTIDAAGDASSLRSGKPVFDVSAAARLELPEIKSSDVPFAKLPSGYVSPAGSVNGKIRLRGEELGISSLLVKTKSGTVDISGTVSKVFSPLPEPNLDVAADLDLPAFKSSDIPLSSVPPGLEVPASRWQAAFAGSLDEVKIRKLRLVAGRNDLEVADGHVAGLRSGAPLFSILLKCRSFVLEELTQLSPQTRQLGLAGSGFFALEVTGKWPKPILAGKMQFKGVGADVQGLKLSGFTGTASFDERRIDIPNLSGSLADGTLGMNLTIKNYVKRPDIDLEASLTQFDLGKFLAAKAAMTAPKPGGVSKAADEPRKAGSPIDARGKLAIGKLLHPNAEGQDVRLNWELTGITPDLKSLNGAAKLSAAGGKFDSLGRLATQSKFLKVLVFPLMIFQKIGSIGGIRLFPDLNKVAFSELAGDYVFSDGIMTLQDSHVYSDAGDVTARGQINLPDEKLDMVVTAQVGKLAPMEVNVRGTFDNPSAKLNVGKFLADPAKQLLQNLFRPR